MTDDIRERMRFLIKLIKECESGTAAVIIRNWGEFLDVEASLRPSREEIADALEYRKKVGIAEQHWETIDYAIEELRRKDDSK